MPRSTGRRPSPPPSKVRIPLKGSRREPSSTSLHAYQQHVPTDPFSALSLLRKLLNNTARSRYKMTPEDHKLFLHLLTVIEPFVSVSPVNTDDARRTITRQPNEILDMIAFHIDSRKDLLALALTCQRLRDVVLPRHLEYRVIHCKPSSEKVWRHLITHPLLACNVRRLQVMDDRSREPELIPTRVVEEEIISTPGIEMHAQQQRLIVGALARMTTLASFSWACNNSLVSFDDVSPTLFTCHMLKEVEIYDNLMFRHAESQEDVREDDVLVCGTSEVPDLTSVAIRTARINHRSNKHPSLIRIQGLLISHCPNLTTLRIGYDHRRPFIPLADEFLSLGRWPCLRILSLQNLWCSTHTGFDAAAEFLAAHPLIETLHFELGRVQLDLPPGTLPNLKELMCAREVAVAILDCPLNDNGCMRPLEVLKGFKLGGGRDDVLLKCLKGYSGLKRIELLTFNEVDDVRKLAEVAPRVTWLDVGKKSSSPAKANTSAMPSVNEWASVLCALPELTAFHGVHFFYEFTDAASHSDRSRIKKNDEVASMLTWKCPKLRRVDYLDNSGKVVILGEKLKWEVRRAKV